ncbi:hornerin-like [Astyanax mexicanus]|uniref:Hornerin-like n=1 Tax=Astyanax mexicanus TaxID=7994 RepID=A0A8T2LM09_ASTMX|nr:hornerin-like [Astyanax mexicanus]
MEKYFTPVCGSSEDELKLQKHQRHGLHHHVQHRHPNQNQYRGPHGPSPLGEYRRLSDTHGLHQHDYPSHTLYHRNHASSVGQNSRQNTLSRASTSSLSSSSSSSPWTSEPSLDNERYLLQNKPQHSLSCSNIPEARHKFQDEESEDLDFDQSDSAVFSHHRHQQEHPQKIGKSEKQRQGLTQRQKPSQLRRGQSRSEERLEQSLRAVRKAHPIEPGPLYKTTSLGQNLAFNESTTGAAARGMAGPKRAVSSIQLPSKGILKNKDEGQLQGNFRKSKSMEVLSTRVQVTGQRKQSTVETVKADVLKGKLDFSAFLDEITMQVISPSRLSSFGITRSPTQTSPKMSHEEHRQPTKAATAGQERTQSITKQHSSKPTRSDEIRKGMDSNSPSHSHRKPQLSKNNRNRHTATPSSPSSPQQQLQHQQHSYERRPSNTESPANRHGGTSSHKQKHGKYNQLHTDGTSTSPEPVQQEKHHHAKHTGPHRGGRGLAGQPYTVHEHRGSPPPARTSGVESESHSGKSSTATSPSSENSQKHKHPGHRRHSKNSQKDSASIEDRAELLEQYSKELHENLLQAVACIENMEGELQCSKAELNSFKEKYKRLQENYSSCQQANIVIEQKLQSVVDSMNSERKYHMHRIMELTKQLDAAKNTIISLENINVPCLIKELLDKHFDSQEAVRSFLLSPSSPAQSDTDQSNRALGLRDNKSPAGREEEQESDWFFSAQRGLSDRQQHVTAFLPWTESQDPWTVSEKTVVDEHKATLHPKPEDSNLPFTVADISQAIYRKITDEKSKGEDSMVTVHHLGLETDMHSGSMWRANDVPANPYSLEDTGTNRAAGVQRIDTSSVNSRKDSNEVTYISAQKMLDDFMSQIPSPVQEGPLERDHVGRDWARRPAEGF